MRSLVLHVVAIDEWRGRSEATLDGRMMSVGGFRFISDSHIANSETSDECMAWHGMAWLDTAGVIRWHGDRLDTVLYVYWRRPSEMLEKLGGCGVNAVDKKRSCFVYKLQNTQVNK